MAKKERPPAQRTPGIPESDAYVGAHALQAFDVGHFHAKCNGRRFVGADKLYVVCDTCGVAGQVDQVGVRVDAGCCLERVAAKAAKEARNASA